MSIVNDIINLVSKHEERIAWDDYFISIAFLISSRSSCHRLHVGCVIVKNTRIISVGYNGFLPGAPHNSRVIDGHEQSTSDSVFSTRGPSCGCAFHTALKPCSQPCDRRGPAGHALPVHRPRNACVDG